jgi:hypothetical protein
MGSPIPRPLVAQAVVVFTAVVLFTGVLTIIGSSPTSDIREHALPHSNVTATPVPDRDDMLSQPDMEILTLPANLSGNGSGYTQSFRLEPGLVAFDMRQDSPGDFEVWLMYDGNERFDRLLENGVIAEGPVTEQIVTGGTYFLEVTSDVGWHIDISQVEPE